MPSAVAGVLEAQGGLRIVVTQRWRMHNHVKKGERLFVLPGVEVEEPVPWDEIPLLIHRVQLYVAETLAPVNHCGTCGACCHISFVLEDDFRKPSYTDCPNCVQNFGCKIYQSRPNVCRSFECIWLKSQSRNDKMPPELRPDRCGVFFAEDTQTNDPLVFEVHGKNPNEAAQAYIEEMARLGYKPKKITRYIGES